MDDFNAATAAPDASPAPAPEANSPASLDDAIDSAFEQVDAAAAEKEGDKPAGEPAGRARNPDGTFAAAGTQQPPAAAAKPEQQQPAQATTDAQQLQRLNNWSAEAKAAWASAPEPLKAEVARTVTELENGIRQYQEQWEPLKQFDAVARERGTSIQATLDNYLQIANGLRSENIDHRVGWIDRMCRFAGTDLQTLAAAIMGQKPDEVQQASDRRIQQLEQHIRNLEQQVGGVAGSMRAQHEMAVQNYVIEVAGSMPRFEELSETMVRLIDTGWAGDVESAYALAERMNPAPVQTQAPPANAAQTRGQAPAHTRNGKAGLSVSGSPGGGSNPPNRARPASLDEALDYAMGASGL